MDQHTYYSYYAQQGPGILIPPDDYCNNYGQYAAQRSKTPTSLVNHSGHSPGPLSTPPMSRDASRGPEPLPEQIPYDDGSGSLSNSPTSVRTPEYDSSELDDYSMRDFYLGNGGIMTTEVSHGPLTAAIDNQMFLNAQGTISDQDIQQAWDDTMAAHQFQTPFNMQSRPQQGALLSQPYNAYMAQTFTNHNLTNHNPPWTSQGPPRNPNVPPSGIVVFDPASDPANYSAFNSSDVNLWTVHNTDPSNLASPNEPLVSPQELFSIASQDMMQRQQLYSQCEAPMQNHACVSSSNPIEMRLQRASPSPDSQHFVNYDASSSLFTKNYRTHSHQHRPTITTPIELPSSIFLQSPTSPLASASSPGGSEAMFSSYQQSDPGMEFDPHAHRTHNQTHPPASSIEVEPSPTRTIPEFSPARTLHDFSSDPSPEPEGRPARRQVGPIRSVGRPGGRALGTHLEPKVAKAAHDMRKIHACWHCVLQRDKCGPGDICERCVKRAQRPNADCGLGCSRIKLIDLSQAFLPHVTMQIHNDSNLTHFVTQFIHTWQNQEFTIYMTCEQKTMPRLPIKVYEFLPRGEELLIQIQYQTDPATQKRYVLRKRSPPLGMVHINHNEEKTYDRYLNDIVDNHLDAFGDICWAEDDNDFAPRLFKLMTRVKTKSDDEAKLLREVFRLIVCNYIMSHTLTIAEETKIQTLSRMRSYTDSNAFVQNYTSPRMANRQLKYFFARLQRATLAAVLNKLQQIFKSSKGCEKWLAAFVAVIGMAMAHEDQQKTVHQVMSTRASTEGFDDRDAQAQADIANRELDERMNFVSQIFRWKYNRKHNPLRDCDQDWEKEAGFGDESSVTFIRSVAQLVRENIDYLTQRQSISISPANQGKYTARLVSQFLLSFWLPQ